MATTINDPSTKYSQPSSAPEMEPLPLSYFNYHEYLVQRYAPTKDSPDSQASPHSQQSDQNSSLSTNVAPQTALVVNHFPNPYTPRHSDLYKKTRVVRIPRQYDSVEFLYMVPQYSTFVPGDEPAAIKGERNEFVTCGKYDSSIFGATSATPLVPNWISEEEFVEIVKDVNSRLEEAWSPQQTLTWLDNVMDFLTATLYLRLFTTNVRDTFLKRKMEDLERYVGEVNQRLKQRNEKLALISPVKSAFLSLDFQIPTPGETVLKLENDGMYGK
ncbi:CIC11C00000001727 [Sungouiella intermedia]|uniref:Ras modification protein ERF4 n=1 Tax=Sungouiella intermedia TaxID=45354 RepID=A0A1L0BU83_9ASCO|nr:CIC11C00000001727 [[Candida] intermedia]